MNKRTSGAAPKVRRRNARGEGGRLAEEIVDGAIAIIERTDSDEEVTLRSVAREVGIAAPSIYAHYADRDAIMWAVVVRVFEQIYQALEAAISSIDESDDVGRLVAGCESYVAYGLENPELYRALFAREFPPGFLENALGSRSAPVDPKYPEPPLLGTPSPMLDDRFPTLGGQAFALLVDSIERCVTAGCSESVDSFADATAVWVGLHGTVSLWSTLCDFPWPDTTSFVKNLVLALARVRVDEKSDAV